MPKSVVIASPELLAAMNQAIGKEMQVSFQYRWQGIQWSGVKGFAVKDELIKIANEELSHAQEIATRLYYLGGMPTTKPSPIFVGADLAEMIEQDVKDETSTIELYQKICTMAREAQDETTNRIFREILEDEESHHDTFVTLQEGL